MRRRSASLLVSSAGRSATLAASSKRRFSSPASPSLCPLRRQPQPRLLPLAPFLLSAQPLQINLCCCPLPNRPPHLARHRPPAAGAGGDGGGCICMASRASSPPVSPSSPSLSLRFCRGDSDAQDFLAPGRHRMHRCINVTILSLNHAMDLIATKIKNSLCCYNSEERRLKTYKRRVCGSSIPDELVYDILLRLPVKTLYRSKSVCKAWCAIISNPSFIHRHLKHSASRHEQEPSYLITPHTLSSVIEDEVWPTTFSNNIPFYHWQDGKDSACLVHATDFHGEFSSVHVMSHCEGLVMLPTDTKIYVFNPAIGDVLKLPDGQKNNIGFQTAGLGLDLGTNTYKVVRSFYRSVDFSKQTYSAGMEVFTIGGHNSSWRTVEDPPYPVMSQLPMYFKGSLYWHICEIFLEGPPEGFLRFDLEDETFSFIRHPALPSEDNRLDFVEIGGELCLAQYLSTQMVIWKSPSGDNQQWDRLYVIDLPEARRFQPLDFLSDRILLRSGNRIYHFDEANRTAKEVVRVDQLRYKNPRAAGFDFVGQDFYFSNIIPYTESLVPLTTRSR